MQVQPRKVNKNRWRPNLLVLCCLVELVESDAPRSELEAAFPAADDEDLSSKSVMVKEFKLTVLTRRWGGASVVGFEYCKEQKNKNKIRYRSLVLVLDIAVHFSFLPSAQRRGP